MRYLFLCLGIACLFACTNEQASSDSTQDQAEKQEVPEKITTAKASIQDVEASFKKIIVDEAGTPLKFSSEEAKSRWLIFYPDGRFDADGDVPLRGKWRFSEGKLELYYEEKDRWFVVPFQLHEDGSFSIQNQRMRPQ